MLDDVGGQVGAPKGDETRKETLVMVGLVAKGQGPEAKRRGPGPGEHLA